MSNRSRYRGELSATQYVIWTLGRRELRTASEVHSRVSYTFKGFPRPQMITLATVSGILNRLVKRGDVMRIKGFGPRGGYGYVLSRKGFARYL